MQSAAQGGIRGIERIPRIPIRESGEFEQMHSLPVPFSKNNIFLKFSFISTIQRAITMIMFKEVEKDTEVFRDLFCLLSVFFIL